MADKELVIRLKLDRTQADASGKQYVQSEKTRQKELLDDAKVQEAAKLELIKRANAAKVKAAADAADEAKKQAKAAADAEKQAAREAVAAAKAGKEEERAATRAAAEEAKRLAKEAAEAEKQASRDATSAAKKAAADERAAKKATAEETKKQAKAKAAAEKEAAAAARETASAEAAVAGGLLSIVQGAVGIGTVTSAMRAMLGAVAGANEELRKQVDDLIRIKDMVREVAVMTGNKNGADYTEVRKFGELRVASGLTNEEARDLNLEYEGAIGAAKGTNISAEESDRLKPMIARFAASTGSGADAAGTYGKLTGLLAGLKHYDKAEDLLAEASSFNKIVSLGVGSNPVLIKQAAQVAGAFINSEGTGVVKNTRELGALTAVASRINPETAAETLKSTARVTRGFGEKWGGLLKETGVGEHDTMGGALQKLFAKMKAVEGTGRAVDAWLAEKGLDMHGRQSLMSMYNYRSMLDKAMTDQETMVTPQQAQAEIEQRFAASTELRAKQRRAQLEHLQMQNADRLLPNRELDLAAQVAIENRGEGLGNPAARGEDMIQGAAASAAGALLPSGMTNEQLGRLIRIEHEKRDLMKKAGVELPNRPEESSLMGGYSAAYVNFLVNGEADQMYASAAQEAAWSGKMRVEGPGIPKIARPAPAVAGGGAMAIQGPGLPQALRPADAGGAGPLPGLGGPGAGAPAPAGGMGGAGPNQQLERVNANLERQTKLMEQDAARSGKPNLSARPNVPRR